MTTSRELIAAIEPNLVAFIVESYLVAADRAAEEEDTDREEALRWLAEKREFPHLERLTNSQWFWPKSAEANRLRMIFYKHREDHYTDWGGYNSFEGAVEAFIKAWPMIKPKKEHNILKPEGICIDCGLSKKFILINKMKYCEPK